MCWPRTQTSTLKTPPAPSRSITSCARHRSNIFVRLIFVCLNFAITLDRENFLPWIFIPGKFMHVKNTQTTVYYFSYYMYVQQLLLTLKGLRQFTLAPLVISCWASFTSPSTQAINNDIFWDYRINKPITEQRSVVTVHVSPYLVYMKQVLRCAAGPNNN